VLKPLCTEFSDRRSGNLPVPFPIREEWPRKEAGWRRTGNPGQPSGCRRRGLSCARRGRRKSGYGAEPPVNFGPAGFVEPLLCDPVSIISLEQLKRKLRWQDISFERRVQSHAGKEYRDCVFKLQPSEPEWSSVDLHFDSEITVLDPLGFSNWHGHYDRWDDDRRNLVDALRTVRELVIGKLCLLEELGVDGKYRGGSLVGPVGIPSTLSKDVQRFRRVFFNRPPVDEEIDFARYWESKHLFVEWKTKHETEKIWTEHGMPITW
jgi:hypothetical protein